MALAETTYLRRIHVARSPVQEAQARNDEVSIIPRQLVRKPQVVVSPEWKMILPKSQFMTVLPYADAAGFRSLCQSASYTERQDGDYDVLALWRKGARPVYLTGILTETPKRFFGVLSPVRRHRKDLPHIAVSILYGHPDTAGFIDYQRLFAALEDQFGRNGFDRDLRHQMVKAWGPHLRQLDSVLQSLEEHAFAVTLSGFNGFRGILSDLNIRRIPIVTDAVTNALNAIWPDIPFQVGRAGGFVRVPEDDGATVTL